MCIYMCVYVIKNNPIHMRRVTLFDLMVAIYCLLYSSCRDDPRLRRSMYVCTCIW